MELADRYASLIDDLDAFRQTIASPLPVVVRQNPIKATRSQTLAGLTSEGVTVTEREWNEQTLELSVENAGKNWAYYHGWIHGQEEVSQIPVTLLDVDSGDIVWDAAAAPGGKATQLAATVRGDGGYVVANDVNLGRLAALRSNADRLGVDNLIVTNQNARTYSVADVAVETFDGALVDAPCSGEGTVRKNPDVNTVTDQAGRMQLSAIQRDILERAIHLTKPGGSVVYSTCTLAPEENEAVVSDIVEATAAQIEPFETGLTSNPGITAWQGDRYHPSVSNTQRFYPHHNDTGGFYCAKLRVSS